MHMNAIYFHNSSFIFSNSYESEDTFCNLKTVKTFKHFLKVFFSWVNSPNLNLVLNVFKSVVTYL